MTSIKRMKPRKALADLEDLQWVPDKSQTQVDIMRTAHFLVALNYSVEPGLTGTAVSAAWRRFNESITG